MYILVAGPEAATPRPQPPSPPGDGTPRALGGWLTELGHNITSDSGDDPVVTAWQWLAGHQAFEGYGQDKHETHSGPASPCVEALARPRRRVWPPERLSVL